MDKTKIVGMINEENAIGFLGTLDGNLPKVRPISAKYYENKLLFSTFTGSNKLKQVDSNNNVEMSWLFPDGSHIRVEGKLERINEKDFKKKYLEVYPMLKKYFKDENDPNYTLVELKPSNVNLNLMGEMEYKNINW